LGAKREKMIAFVLKNRKKSAFPIAKAGKLVYNKNG
jgi:hypothetical protein